MAQPDTRPAPRAGHPQAPTLLIVALLIVALPGWAEPGPPDPDLPFVPAGEGPRSEDQSNARATEGPTALDPGTRWLDEVRAQREAWEERRKASREAFEARRRVAAPWGAAQHEAWEDEVERRREARRLHREEERELFRALGPSQPPPPLPEGMEPQGTYPVPAAPSADVRDPATADRTPSGFAEPQLPGIVYPPGAPPRGPYSPQDWDNLWYYRGY